MTLDRALWVCLEGAVLASLVGVLCALLPRLRPGHKAILWWLVSAKLLFGLAPIPTVQVAALPATEISRDIAAVAPESPAAGTVSPATEKGPGMSPARGAAWAWLVSSSFLCLAALPDWRRARRWLRAGRPLDDDAWRLTIARARAAVGLRRTPRVLAVPGLGSPLVTGWLRPVVLLPADVLERLGAAELEMVLAHELAHVARGDLWLGLVPALARRIFFFHPAAWIAEREYAIAREAACDEAVLGGPGADPFAYGRLLLRLATRRPFGTAIPMSPHSMLRRRLEMMETMVSRVPFGRAGWVLAAVAILAVVPVRIVAKESADIRCLDIGKGKDGAYVITDGRSHSMCGDPGDVPLAERQRRKGEDLVWFRVDDQEWVIRDPAAVAEARRLFAPVSEIGEEQAAIGEKQSHLGAEQSRIGTEQGEICMRQAEEAERMAALALRDANEALRGAGPERVERSADAEVAAAEQAEKAAQDKRRAELKALTEDSRGREDKETRMRDLGARMELLGLQQAELGERQSELGEKMTREIATAQRSLSRLLERAMRDGTALRAD